MAVQLTHEPIDKVEQLVPEREERDELGVRVEHLQNQEEHHRGANRNRRKVNDSEQVHQKTVRVDENDAVSHRETEPADSREEQRHGKEQRDALILNRLVQELAQTNYTPITARKAREGGKEDIYSPRTFQVAPNEIS